MGNFEFKLEVKEKEGMAINYIEFTKQKQDQKLKREREKKQW